MVEIDQQPYDYHYIDYELGSHSNVNPKPTRIPFEKLGEDDSEDLQAVN